MCLCRRRDVAQDEMSVGALSRWSEVGPRRPRGCGFSTTSLSHERVGVPYAAADRGSTGMNNLAHSCRKCA